MCVFLLIFIQHAFFLLILFSTVRHNTKRSVSDIFLILNIFLVIAKKKYIDLLRVFFEVKSFFETKMNLHVVVFELPLDSLLLYLHMLVNIKLMCLRNFCVYNTSSSITV
jgi:hypothetical protein